MHVEIRTNKFTLTNGMRDHINRRIQFALSWADHHMDQITLNLRDINGPKGGSDKSCRIQIRSPGSKTIVVEEIQNDLYIAIDRAIERAARALTRKLKRHREYSHQRYEHVIN